MMKRKMMGMSPAWKRHLIRQRRNDLCDKNSMHKICTKNNATTTTTTHTVSKDDGTSLLPPSPLMTQIKSFSIGSIAGLMGSLAGMGGGFVMIPLMTAAAARRQASSKGIFSLSSWRGGLGLQQHQAHGTSLFAVGTTGLAGALGYGITMSSYDDDEEHDEALLDDEDEEIRTKQQTSNDTEQKKKQKGLVQLDTALALATTAMITARFGAIASSRLSERMLQRALGAFMICVAPLVPGKAYLESLHDNGSNPIPTERDVTTMQHLHGAHKSQVERLLPASVIGMFSGFLAGIFGVGGGAIVVPALVLSTDMPYHSALGTSLCAMVLPAVVGCYTDSLKGNVNWRVAPMLAFGSAVGSFFGGREVGLNMDEGYLRAGFSCLMFVLGVKTWRKGSGR